MLVDVDLYAFGATDGLGLLVAVLLVDADLLAVLLLLRLRTRLAIFENSYVLGVGLDVQSDLPVLPVVALPLLLPGPLSIPLQRPC